MKYFENFPTIDYPYVGKLVDSVDGYTSSLKTTDFTIRFKFIDSIMKDPSAYYSYYWKDGQRPDLLAQQYYGDADLAWVVMMSGSVFDWIYDLPLDDNTFTSFLMSKYKTDDVYSLGNIVHHYETGQGYIIDSFTYANLANDPNKRVVSVYDYETDMNEAKRNIKLISKAYVPMVLTEFDSKLKEIKRNRALIGETE